MPIRGYTSVTAASPGGLIDFHLSAGASARSVVLRVVQVGRMDVERTRTTRLVGAHADPAYGSLEFFWPVAWALSVPSDWPTGLYVLQALEGPGPADFVPVVEFVVRPSRPGALSRVLLATDFITPQAYNTTGGRCFYGFESGGRWIARSPTVSFNRPPEPAYVTSTIMHGFIRWLEAQSITVEHGSTVDLHANASLLDAYDCLVFGHHVEYWSRAMRSAVERFVRRGGNVVSLSGNTCYRQVRFERTYRTLVCQKTAATDPVPDPADATVAFAQPPVHRAPDALLGVGWTHGAWYSEGGRVPYTVHFPGHWTMTGAALETGQRTRPFLGYETDATGFVIEPEGHPRVTGEEGAPLSTVVLASAEFTSPAHKPGLATATLLVRGGAVFSAGTTEWMETVPYDAALSRITLNVLGRLSARRPFDWEAVGHARDVTALTALEGRLFATTRDDRLWLRHPVLADARWRPIGHANRVSALAADRGHLFCIAAGNLLFCRRPQEQDITWSPIGSGPTGGVRAMAGLGGALYAIGGDGRLWTRPSRPEVVAGPDAGWRLSAGPPARADVVAMTSLAGILLVATSGGRLLRSSSDFVGESLAWVDLAPCPATRGLAVVQNMLFSAGTDHRLSWLDLHHPEMGRRSTAT